MRKVEDVGGGEGVQQPVQAPEEGERIGSATPKTISRVRGDHGGFHRLAQRLEEDERSLVDGGQDHHAQINPKAFDRKRRIIDALIRGAENADQLPGEEPTTSRAAAPTAASAASSLVKSAFARSRRPAPTL